MRTDVDELKIAIIRQVKIINELNMINQSIESLDDKEDSKLAESQIESLKKALRKSIEHVTTVIEDIALTRPLPKISTEIKEQAGKVPVEHPSTKKPVIPAYIDLRRTKKSSHKIMNIELSELEKKTLKRLKQSKIEKGKIKEKKPSKYVKFANSLFGKQSLKLSKKNIFIDLKRDLIMANLDFVPTSYISSMLLSMVISFFVGFLVFAFLMMFSIGIDFPIITRVQEAFGLRFIKVFWTMFAFPAITFVLMYFYPSAEKSYLENKINQELPFATIHMSAISQSMLEPSKIFSIMITTGEYPFLQKEFIKIINQINIYGYDLVSALRNVAFYSSSKKLSELLNGLATTINSGGGLPEFFDKRAQSLLFDYRLEREKYTKSAETFMDIYISLVIAAPMILMLLLIMMRISGLGIAISTSTITLIMILGVATINAMFLIFLQLKQPKA